MEEVGHALAPLQCHFLQEEGQSFQSGCVKFEAVVTKLVVQLLGDVLRVHDVSCSHW
jgi:hypothetical protein